MEDVLRAIYVQVKNSRDYTPYLDLKDYCREVMKTDIKLGVRYLELLSDSLEYVTPYIEDLDLMKKFYELHKTVCLTGAPYSFHLFLIYMEWWREPKKKFYIPRKNILRRVVKELQALSDGDLNLLCISMPPGTGKSTLALFYICWLAGRNPEKCILTGSHSNAFIRGAYDECVRIMDGHGEYQFADVFPDSQISNTNAKDCRIDLGKRKRFESLQFTSIGSGNAGLYRASQLLYCDDLVPSIEVALSKERLDKLWEQYTTDLRQRMIGDCVQLHIATRWSVHDVIGRLEQEYGGSDTARFITIPALNEKDESNFDYPYGVGFSTEFYHEQRDIMDDTNWRALYMNQPIEREGLVYNEDELRRFFDMPTSDPDSIIAVCDTKDRGKDYCVLPVAYVYGQDYYIVDALCDNGLPDVVDARLVDILYRYKVRACRFESNSAGGRVAKETQDALKTKGGVTHITTKFSTQNKETRIITASGWVKEHCLFKDPSMYKRNSDYGRFMDFLTTYTMSGKNKHDDVPDAVAMLSDFAIGLSGASVEVFKRPW